MILTLCQTGQKRLGAVRDGCVRQGDEVLHILSSLIYRIGAYATSGFVPIRRNPRARRPLICPFFIGWQPTLAQYVLSLHLRRDRNIREWLSKRC